MNAQLAPHSMSLPPPDLDLFDGARVVGWVRGSTLGFRGFANESEAAGAAWVVHRTLARRLARRHGGPVPPIDVEPLSLARDGDRATILAGGRAIATLVPPGADSRSGPESFGFEIEVPAGAADALAMRSLAHRTYQTLRKSGARWAMWERRPANRRRVAPRRNPAWVPARRADDSAPAPIAFVSKLVLAAIAIVLGVAAIAHAPLTVTVPIGVVLVAGLVASNLVALVGRRRAVRGAPRARRPRPAAAAAASLADGARWRDDPSDESMRERGWVALGVVSIAVLALALVVPKELAVVLAAIGFAGLAVFRLTATWVGWTPDRTARVRPGASREPAAVRPESASLAMSWRSSGAAGSLPEPRSSGSPDGASARFASR